MILSPVTGNPHTKLYDKIPVSIIESKYMQELNFDVRRFFKTDFIEIHECLDTGFRFYYPFNIEGDDKLYEHLQQMDWYYSIWYWEHQITADLIKNTDKVLEVGCGTGNFLKVLKEKNISGTGLELNKKAIQVCKEIDLNVYNELLNEHVLKYNNYYDFVCSFQVLEHVAEVKAFIDDCIKLLKPGGKVMFGVPNNNPYLFKRDKFTPLNLPPHHMGLWSVKAFNNLPKYFNIKKIKIEVEDLIYKQHYFNLLFDSFKLPRPFNKIKRYFSPKVIDKIAKYADWKGRNIVAVFEKI